MTPLERAIAAGHPSAALGPSGSADSSVEQPAGERGPGRSWYPAPVRSDVVDAPPPRDTMSGDGGSAAAESSSTPWEFCHSTASTIESLTDLWRRLRAGRHE